MSLERLLAAIERAGDSEAAVIVSDAEATAAAIETAACEQAEAAAEAGRQAALEGLGARREARLRLARHDADFLIAQARGDLVGEALDAIRARLGELRNAGDYRGMMLRWLHEAVGALDEAGPLLIEVDPQDTALVRELACGERPFTIRARLNTNGGLRVGTADELVWIDNTIETRLARALPLLRARLAATFQVSES